MARVLRGVPAPYIERANKYLLSLWYGHGVTILAKCSAWMEERRAFTTVLENDLSLPAIIRQMVEEAWSTISSF